MATTPPPPPGFDPAQPFDPTQPFNPTNRNDPRYDPRRDPSNDPRWQRDQARAWQRAQKAQADAWRNQQRFSKEQRKAYERQMLLQAKQTRALSRVQDVPSFIGPLLLIGVGIIALLIHRGRLDWPALLFWYSRWWPVLLIAIGVLRLVEWGIDRATRSSGGAPVRYRVGGGVVFLVIVLSVLGLAAQHGIHHDGQAWFLGWNNNDLNKLFGTRHEEDSPAVTRALAPAGTLYIESGHGDITVTGTSDDGQLHLTTHKTVFTSSDDNARERFNSVEPQFTGTADSLTLRSAGSGNDQADLTLLVPSGVHVNLTANHGDVHATNLKAPVNLTANHGDLEIAAITGTVSAHANGRHGSLTMHSISGAVDVQGSGDELNLFDISGRVQVHGDFFGGGRLQHITGPVDFQSERITFAVASLDGEASFDDHDEFNASGAAGPMTLRTRSRDITLSRIAGEVSITNNHGKVELISVPPSGNITIDNHQGDVELTLPTSTRFSLAADTSDGSIQSDFPGVNGIANQNGRGTLTTSVNGGGANVRVTTTHGNITVNRNTESALPKAAPNLRLGFGALPTAPSTPAPPSPPANGTEDEN